MLEAEDFHRFIGTRHQNLSYIRSADSRTPNGINVKYLGSLLRFCAHDAVSSMCAHSS